MMTLMSLFAYGSNRCESIFVTMPSGANPANLGDYGINAGSMEPYYISMFRDHTRATGFQSKEGIVTQDIFNSQSEDFSTVITQFKAKNNSVSHDGRFIELVRENIDFVLATYSERRDWSPELRTQLKKEAELYAEQSTYIEVRRLDQIDFTPQELIGTMKIVRVDPTTRISRLPLEVDFSIQLPANAGRKFEPSNFVVDKTKNKLGTAEIFTQLVLHAREQLKNPRHEPEKMMYFTPADKLGRKMYARLGFTAVPGFEAALKEGDKDWWMIGSTAENLARLPDQLAENKMQWPAEDIAWMNKLITNFQGLSGTKTELEGFRTKQIRREVGDVQEFGFFLSEPFTYKQNNFRRLSLVSMLGGEVELNLRIPAEAFPLKDGWRLKIGRALIIYKDSLLKIYDPTLRLQVTIKVDPLLKAPESVYYKDNRNKFTAMF